MLFVAMDTHCVLFGPSLVLYARRTRVATDSGCATGGATGTSNLLQQGTTCEGGSILSLERCILEIEMERTAEVVSLASH